jgi:hypothetical protein
MTLPGKLQLIDLGTARECFTTKIALCTRNELVLAHTKRIYLRQSTQYRHVSGCAPEQ